MGTDQVPPGESGEPIVPAAVDAKDVVASARPESPGAESNEFLWLFEYGLGMDASFLNSRERLDGSALLYGPAVLKGYQVAFNVVESPAGQVVATIAPSHAYGAEVWGVLYRIPHRLTERHADQPSQLDNVHPYFEPMDVVVYETHRKREVACITYVASAIARRQFHLLPPEQQIVDASYAKHLLESARQHKLPQQYLQELLARSAVQERLAPLEQDTEPLSVVMGRTGSQTSTEAGPGASDVLHPNRWLTAYALYLVVLLLVVLSLAVLQGLEVWSNIFTARFAPLGIPWFVLVYGLLGGCVSSIIMLGRRHAIPPVDFVLITWFARPYLGAILAALAYLILNSGFFVVTENTAQHNALYSLVGALAGLCEGWVFYRRT